MKISNWRRKLAASLVAGGMLSPAAAHAANLNTNLVTNGDFETVDINVFGEYGSPLVLNWTGPNLYAYSHDNSTTAGSGQNGNPATVPDYADGANPPNAGHWYFTANNTNNPADTDMNTPGAYYQDVDVSTGATASAIGEGKGRADLSAYMSSYLNDNDRGNVRVEFRDNVGASLGFTEITDSDPGSGNVWNLNSGSGAIPVGTSTLRVSLFGTAVNSGADGYIDNVDVRVNQTVNPQFLTLEINTVNGQAALKNQTGQAIQVDYYEIVSAGSSLRTAYSSLQDQNLPAFPAGNGTGNGWEESGGNSNKILSESKLNGSSAFANGASVSLGNMFTVGAAQDVKFRYSVVTADPLDSDFNSSGASDGVDFLTWQRNFGLTSGASKATGSADGDVDVDGADFTIWKGEFGSDSFSNPGSLLLGAVRYVTTGPGVGVPEPSAVLVAALGLPGLGMIRRARRLA